MSQETPFINHRIKDITGQHFGNLIAISMIGNHPTEQVTMWLFQCSCGNTVERRATSVKQSVAKGFTPCCSECWIPPNRLDKGQSDKNSVVANYRQRAKRKGLEFLLSEDQIDRLFASDCHYCGALPNNSISKASSYGEFVYNGIDRIDNELGYVATNVVSCCGTCNRAKADLTYEEFRTWVRQVSTHMEVR